MSRPVDSAPARAPARQRSSPRTNRTQSPRSPQRNYLASAVPAFSALNESLRPLPALRRFAAEAAKLAEDGSNAEPAKSAEELLSLCGLGALCVVTVSASSAPLRRGREFAAGRAGFTVRSTRAYGGFRLPYRRLGFVGQEADRGIACLYPQRWYQVEPPCSAWICRPASYRST